LTPVLEPGVASKEPSITAGNASQLSDGASASVLMSDTEASRRGLTPLGIYRGMAVAGVAPDEMGIGPVFAVPKLLDAHGLKIDDIGLWELNEAFAVQALACIRDLGLNPDIVNEFGGAIALGHPPGASGTRIALTLLNRLEQSDEKRGLATMCVGVGQGSAVLLERA
ncbi:acetyl-CoA C-acyltransferase, partial [Burkholderia multivorans]